MKIHDVQYAGTVAQPNGPLPGDLPQVGFSGRSNVGKSSLINLILRRTRNKLAHVSGRPGKTQALNFYSVDGRFYLVDFPGFGYAQVPKALRDAWGRLIDGYLARPDVDLRGMVHLVDARREPTPHDVEMLEFLAKLGTPVLVVLTKVDKLKKRERMPALERACTHLGIDADQVILSSASTGEGRDELLAAIDALLSSGEEAGA